MSTSTSSNDTSSLKTKPCNLYWLNPVDLVINELIQAKKPIPLLVEPKDFQLVEFEPVNNHLTPSSIKTTYVFVHHYHNMHVQDNNVIVSNDPNDVFVKELIDVYFSGVSNLKGCVHS